MYYLLRFAWVEPSLLAVLLAQIDGQFGGRTPAAQAGGGAVTMDVNTLILSIATLLMTGFGSYLTYLTSKNNGLAVKTAETVTSSQVSAAAQAKTVEDRAKVTAANLADHHESQERGLEAIEKITLDQNKDLQSLAATAESTHSLVNGGMQAQLDINRRTTQRTADVTHDPADIEIARLAEAAFQRHVGLQTSPPSTVPT